jgi:hypothetical protein
MTLIRSKPGGDRAQNDAGKLRVCCLAGQRKRVTVRMSKPESIVEVDMMKFLLGVAVGGALAVTTPIAYNLFVEMVNKAGETEIVQEVLG